MDHLLALLLLDSHDLSKLKQISAVRKWGGSTRPELMV